MVDRQRVLITGAGRGIGWAVAQSFAASLPAGSHLFLLGRDAARLQARAAELKAAFPISAHSCPADVTDAASIAEVVPALGTLDVVVNNAGFGASQPFARMTDAHWREMLSVNLDGVFHVTRAAIAPMLKAGKGRIINIASTAGLTGYGYVAAYCAAKHGVVGLTRALAREYAKSGITVNAVCPGYADTEMTETTIATIVAKTGRSAEAARAELAAGNPQGRLVTPEEVAATVLWLASPQAASITGQAIAVAGGEVMG